MRPSQTPTTAGQESPHPTPHLNYDNSEILDVLDYLQEEIEMLKQNQAIDSSGIKPTSSSQPTLNTTRTSANALPSLSLSSMDSNQDNFLSQQESGLEDQSFNIYDLNQDGKISAHEISMAEKKISKAKQHASQRDRNDGNFPIEKNAWSRSDKEFGFIDKNADQVIDEQEYVYYLTLADQELRRFDYNRDGWISLEEFGQGQVRFDQMDTDKDHKIYAHEIRRALYRGFW